MSARIMEELGLIALICQQLCAHCQYPGHVVDQSREVIAEAHKGQATLARLSLTNKAIQRNVAQLILHHMYHSGNIPVLDDERNYTTQAQPQPDQSRLPLFVRTIYENRRLAGVVQAFTFFPYVEEFGQEIPSPLQPLGDGTMAAVQALAAQAGITKLTCPYDEERPQPWDARWYSLVAMFSLPSLQQCLITCSDQYIDELEYLQSCVVRLESLSYLCVVPWGSQSTFHIFETRAIIRNAPNLKTLIAPDCGAERTFSIPEHYMEIKARWDVPLKNLRKLSLSTVRRSVLVQILDHTPMLEDLEFYGDIEECTIKEPPLLFAEDFQNVHSTLRRLSYSITGPIGYNCTDRRLYGWECKDDVDETHLIKEATMFWQENLEKSPGRTTRLACKPLHFEPFDASRFSRLEILEIEQVLLYGNKDYANKARPYLDHSDDYPGSSILRHRLPESLRILHVGTVFDYKRQHQDLYTLVRDMGYFNLFPHLDYVHLDIFAYEMYKDELEVLDFGLFRQGSNGPTIIAGPVPRGPFLRGMLPPRPGNNEYGPTWPAITYPLPPDENYGELEE